MTTPENQAENSPPNELVTEQDIIAYAEAIEANVVDELEFDKFVTESNVARYRAQTTRLAVLSDFACRQISKIGAYKPTDTEHIDPDDMPSKVLRTREFCIIAVLQAIARIAKDSHLPPERGKKSDENSVPNEDPEEVGDDE